MGKTKIKRVNLVGFEKHFDSVTEARSELASIWPEIENLLDTEAGKVLVQYSLLQESDDKLDADMALLNAAGRKSTLNSKGEETLLAKAFGVKGAVCFVAWTHVAFGWEPMKKGGFTAFIEVWPKRVFKRGQYVEQKAVSMGWRQNIEVEATRGQRRMGRSEDLEAFLMQGANEAARMLMPSRLADAGADIPQVMNTEEAEKS